MTETEQFGNAFEMAYQDYSQMVRRGEPTPAQLAVARADLADLRLGVAQARHEEIRLLVADLDAAVRRGDLAAICEARDRLLETTVEEL